MDGSPQSKDFRSCFFEIGSSCQRGRLISAFAPVSAWRRWRRAAWRSALGDFRGASARRCCRVGTGQCVRIPRSPPWPPAMRPKNKVRQIRVPQRRRAHERGLLSRQQPEVHSLVIVHGRSGQGCLLVYLLKAYAVRLRCVNGKSRRSRRWH